MKRRAVDVRDAVAFLGLGAVTTGVALYDHAAALIVGGTILIVLAVAPRRQ